MQFDKISKMEKINTDFFRMGFYFASVSEVYPFLDLFFEFPIMHKESVHLFRMKYI